MKVSGSFSARQCMVREIQSEQQVGSHGVEIIIVPPLRLTLASRFSAAPPCIRRRLAQRAIRCSDPEARRQVGVGMQVRHELVLALQLAASIDRVHLRANKRTKPATLPVLKDACRNFYGSV